MNPCYIFFGHPGNLKSQRLLSDDIMSDFINFCFVYRDIMSAYGRNRGNPILLMIRRFSVVLSVSYLLSNSQKKRYFIGTRVLHLRGRAKLLLSFIQVRQALQEPHPPIAKLVLVCDLQNFLLILVAILPFCLRMQL